MVRSNSAFWRRATRRNAPWLSDADKRILSHFAETRDPRVLTRYYFDWEPFEEQLALLLWGIGYPGRANAAQVRHAVAGARGGKTEAYAMDNLLTAMLVPGREPITLNCSITQDQANIGHDAALRFCESPRFAHWVDDVVSSPFPEIRLRNGHRLWARSTKDECRRIRGHKFVKVTYDEIAYGKEEDVVVLLERLADYNGQLNAGTTPKGKGWYYRTQWKPTLLEYEDAIRSGRTPHAVPFHWSSLDNPHVNPEYWSRIRLTERQRQQEIDALFLDAEGAPWQPADVERCLNRDLEDEFRRYALRESDRAAGVKAGAAKSGERWVTAWDLAKEEDYAVCVAGRVDVKPWRVCYFERFHRAPWPVVEKRMNETQRRFSSDVIFDATGVGSVTKDYLDIPIHRVTPFVFTGKSKVELITNLAYCLQKRLVEFPFIRELLDELYDYQWIDDGLVTDSVMALALFCWFAAGKPGRPAGMI